MTRYLDACNGDSRKAMTLYRYNLQLSQKMFTVVGCFEVALRNAIDRHISSGPLGDNWLRDAVMPGGIFDVASIRDSRRIIKSTYERINQNGGYTKEGLISQLEFGVWKYMFAKPQFKATGSSLLKIFPNKPKSSAITQYNNTYFFNELDGVNNLRNRIAHHEPVCFAQYTTAVDTTYITRLYYKIKELLTWMDIDSESFLYGLDQVESVCNKINSL